jgi:tetratricopeptide (TPR) repeat protein
MSNEFRAKSEKTAFWRKFVLGRSMVIKFIGLLGCAFALWACGMDSAERNNAGNRLYEQGDYQGALAAYQAAAVVEPDRAEAYYNAADALIQTEKLDEATAALEQALKTADDTLAAKAYYNLGNIYFEMGKYVEAAAAYQEALLRRPEDADARHNLELALGRIALPTPTAIEQKVEATESVSDLNATPTNNPAGQGGPPPTPSPAEGPPDKLETPVAGEGETTGSGATTPIPNEDGAVNIEDALSLLDAVQQNQETLRKYLREPSSSGTASGNDW